jgi:hypothetical protein
MLKWRDLKKEKMKKKLGNVRHVPVETETGDAHKEDTGQSTHSLELSGVSTEIKSPINKDSIIFSVIMLYSTGVIATS